MDERIKRDPARHHFARMWAIRHCERVYVFADGTVYDREARREGLRQNIKAQRGHRDYIATH